MTDSRTTILALHPSSLDPNDFLERLTESSSTPVEHGGSGNEDGYSTTYPWSIDNRYYSAAVTLKAVPQELYTQEEDTAALANGIEVVMYLFQGRITSLPPALVRIMVEPRDIALAIRLREGPGSSETTRLEKEKEDEKDELEDLFDEIGMEYLDESQSMDEEDDERPIPIMERIRQTLQTHMWPNMVRKPLASSSRGIDEHLDLDLVPGENGTGQEYKEYDRGEKEEGGTIFPVSFAQNRSIPTTTPLESATDIDLNMESEFPGVEELRSQIMLQHLNLGEGEGGGPSNSSRGLGRLDAFDGLDSENGEEEEEEWVQAEYSRLDDWLEEDGRGEGYADLEAGNTEDGAGDAGLEDDYMEMDNEQLNDKDNDKNDRQESIGPNLRPPLLEGSQFENDFADYDFTPSQSSSRGQSGHGDSVPLDPTPLLLHLQSVREEIAGMDEDTRRKRAGREVENVLKSLGLGGIDWDSEGDEEEEGLGVEGGGLGR